jgi:hypothetical protein
MAACDNDDDLDIPIAGDYYPLQLGNEWRYDYRQVYQCCDGGGFELTDTLIVQVSEDAPFLAEYSVLYDTSYRFSKMARKEDHQYFELPPYRYEYAFLVDNQPVNYSWRDESFDVDLTVKQVNAFMVVSGVRYSNVIEIEEMHRTVDVPEVYTESHRYFARDIGEIYALKVGHFGNNDVDTVEMKLLNYTKP